MALEELKKKIHNEAIEKKEQILRNAEIQAQQILEHGRVKVKDEKETAITRQKDLYNLKLQREKSRLKLEHNRKLGVLKSKYMEQVIEEFASYLIQNDELYNMWIHNLLSAYGKFGDEIVFVGKANILNINSSFVISPEIRQGLGGFYIKKGRLELNFTLEEFLRWVKLEKRLEIYGLLFPERKDSEKTI